MAEDAPLTKEKISQMTDRRNARSCPKTRMKLPSYQRSPWVVAAGLQDEELQTLQTVTRR